MSDDRQVYSVRPNICPVCGHTLSGAMSTEQEQLPPKPGDFTVCASCVAVLRFDRELALRQASPEDLNQAEAAAPGTKAAITIATLNVRLMLRELGPPDDGSPRA